MKLRVLGLFVLLAALAARSGAQAGIESDDELAKKIQLLRDQIEELRKQQNPLLEEQQKRANEKAVEAQRKEQERVRKEAERVQKEVAERQAKELAEKKKHVAKVEIRGLLGKAPETQTPAWYVTINELKWTLDFGANKELAAQAVEFAGKPVVITGTVATVKLQLNPYMIPQAPQQPWVPLPYPQPVPYGLPPQPAGLPIPPQQPWVQPQFTPVEIPLTIKVESLKGATD